MNFRLAIETDIPEIQRVRNSVRENRLSDPALVSNEDCREFLFNRGRGWVAEEKGKITGFAIVDLRDANVWALFVDPVFEGRGIGRRLHDDMLDWFFSLGNPKIWLGTAPQTRAAHFYRLSGWKEVGVHGKGEIKFEMTAADWNNRKDPRKEGRLPN